MIEVNNEGNPYLVNGVSKINNEGILIVEIPFLHWNLRHLDIPQSCSVEVEQAWFVLFRFDPFESGFVTTFQNLHGF